MIDFFLAASLLLSALPLTHADDTSSAYCPTTSVSTIPGCWGVPACAYRLVDDLLGEALCKYDYCDCGGTPVPLLPQTISSTTTIGCASYTVQPTISKCPTTQATIASPGSSPGTSPTSTAVASVVETLTISGQGLTTMTLSPGSSITSTTVLTTDGSTLTVAPIASPKPSSNVQTLTEPNGSTTILTLPSGSSITGLTTITTQGTTLTLAPATKTTNSPNSSASNVIIDGSTITIPTSSSKTITVNGSTITIGPSAIIQSGQTILLPTAQTTITTDGLTLTFASPKETPTGSLQSTGATATTIDSASTITETPVITPPPSGSPGFLPTTIPPSNSPQPQFAITLNNDSFILPHTVSVKLLQGDGSFITLFSSAIASASSTFTFPDLSSPTTINFDGLTFEAGPQPKGDPHTGGASGLSGLINALGSLAGNANAIVNLLDQIGEQGVLWSGGGSDSVFFSGVGNLLDSSVSQLSNFASTLDSTISTYETELDDLSAEARSRVFPAYEGAREEFDILNSLRKLIRDIPSFKHSARIAAKKYWQQGATAAAVLAGAEETLRRFGSYNWKNEQKHATTTTAARTNSTMSTKTTSTNTKKPPKSTAKPTLYMFTTKDGTDLSTFDEFVKSLPDKGEGIRSVYPNLTWQTYATNLTVAQAKEVAKQPFIDYIGPVQSYDTGSYGALPPLYELEKRVNEDINLQERTNSASHLRVISQEKDATLSNYLFDPLLGKGQTIYILDSGFNLDHEELASNADRQVTSHLIPNELTLRPSTPDESLWAPEDMTDYSGHGTLVASIAAGTTHGVASKANLVLVKFRQAAKNPHSTTENLIYRGVTELAMQDTWNFVINDILAKRGSENKGKFIVNMSYGFVPKPDGTMADILAKAIRKCLENDIIFTIPTGNDGEIGVSLDERIPQSMGTADNNLITVGGVGAFGFLAPRTTYDAGRGGSISVYAVSENVEGASQSSNDGFRTDSGTSFAAPAVAGLAAYFAALPSLDDEWPEGSVATAMKAYVLKYAYVRLRNPLPHNLPNDYPKPPRDSIKVIYNRAPEGLCAANLPVDTGNQERQASILDKRQDPQGDIPVVVSGTIVVSSLSQTYCYNTSFPTLTLTSTTAATTATPSPTRNVDDGILTCGTRTDQGNDEYFFTLGDSNAAITKFCGNLTSNATDIVFAPGRDTGAQGFYTPPDNEHVNITLYAFWNSVDDANCPKFNATGEDAFKLCERRLNIPINNCDFKETTNFWKQGGRFYRDCITWRIESNRTVY